MANAAVEKLKMFGLHHGEKLGVGLAATLLVAFVGVAVSKPVLDMQPDQLTKAADASDSNLNQKQKEEDILAKLEEGGLKTPNFLAMVENQSKNALNPDDYRAKLEWVVPEPGAGLIRDQPELIAPTELIAFPGRGGVLMYALDANDKPIVDENAAKNNNLAMGPGNMAGRPPAKGAAGLDKAQQEAEKQRKASLAGTVNAAKEKEEKEKEKAEAGNAAPVPVYKEETKGQRWVTITGVINHAKLKENWATALKTPPGGAAPNYFGVDLERRQKTPEGQWTEWAAVDPKKNYRVLDNIPEVAEELVPDDRRFEALVDPLPFLRAGYWTGVHVAKLVPPEARTLNRPDAGLGGGMMGMMEGGMGMPGMGGMSGMMGSGGAGDSSMGRGSMSSMGGMGGSGSMSGSMMGGMAGMSGEGGYGGAGEDTNFTKSDQPELMIRKLDFSVDPDTTYQFRARVVVVNPNKNQTNVNPGVDVESEHLSGPWSEPTAEVTVPPDVAAYAQNPVTQERRSDIVQFQVMKWDSNSGHTIIKTDDATPGGIVGEFGTAQVPSSDGKGPSNTNIDFNARVVLLDSLGGTQLLPTISGVERNRFETPVVAMVVRPDGTIAVRNQASDKLDSVRIDMFNTYNQAIKDSGKKRQPPGGMMGSGGMPGS